MKPFLLPFLVVVFFHFVPAKAQIIGDEALQQLQNGEVSFLDGEFIVFLQDTVSPDFIDRKFAALNYSISFRDINPILISLVNSPGESVLQRLKDHPSVRTSFTEPEPVDTSYFKGILEEQGLEGDEFDNALNRLVNSQSRDKIYFEFKFWVNENKLKQVMSDFRSVAYQIERNFPRSVNISCEPGNEQALMEEIDKLPFVESTALIGVLGN